eukprot:jgi/Botrbrau1/12596/Bobra.0169s0124.1
MANTSLDTFIKGLNDIMDFADGYGSFNLYMAHGGTNFGYGAGGAADSQYKACITSYDYDAPVSEAGDYGQPGIGGPNRYQAIRDAITAHTGVTPIDPPPPPRVVAYGDLLLGEAALLTQQLEVLASRDGIHSPAPLVMEEYGQQGGMIMYRTFVSAAELAADSVLDLGSPVHDSAQVLLDGKVLGSLDRNGPQTLNLAAQQFKRARLSHGSHEAEVVALDIVVQAIGRSNDGVFFDTKGLVSSQVTLNGHALIGWQVFPLPLDNLGLISFTSPSALNTLEPATDGPVFYRGTLTVGAEHLAGNGFPADTYLSVRSWGKGLAFINGFNLGWYWPTAGPTNTMYVPGPILKVGDNEIILLEVDAAPSIASVSFVDVPDFYGPGGLPRVWEGPLPLEREAHARSHAAHQAQLSFA